MTRIVNKTLYRCYFCNDTPSTYVLANSMQDAIKCLDKGLHAHEEPTKIERVYLDDILMEDDVDEQAKRQAPPSTTRIDPAKHRHQPPQ